MWSRSRIKAAAVVLLGAALAGCAESYLERRDTVSIASGEAMAANRVTMMIDPWPPASANRNIAYNGEKMQAAAERYRLGRVIQPVHATTSSAAYAQTPQQAPTNPGPSAPPTSQFK